ncbi:hypothetical protein [Nonomuraea jiangxiensis]|uniref:Uncharacterized protein n=1 Tax=Nonomuraea jiangxiensis TaxID=633440 RepID=A0A1G9C792_9ACTN|nr:hypothetical protein [Nonomuraea jiangxiensis]SDK47314.1 hypothetical protein SAMN05421869_11689 [Nonomuraea jiangxiensis]
MTDRLFAELRPGELDDLAEDGYRRRRSADLARAFATPRAPRRSRRPYLLMAGTAVGTAVTALAAVAVVVITGEPAQAPARPPAAALPVDARSFLLAAASTALREPAATGRYWYVRERRYMRVQFAPGVYAPRVKALVDAQKRTEEQLKGDPERLAAAQEEFRRKVAELNRAELPYRAFAANTRETWRPMRAGEVARTVRNQDVEVTFGSPQDEAAWRADGAPELADRERETQDDAVERAPWMDNPSLNLRNVADLPTGVEELRRRLDDLWRQSPKVSGADRAGYLWQTGIDLMTAPLKPGTRAALFRVLADQPVMKLEGRVSDPLGRTGVALSAPTQHKFRVRLVVDESTAELLQYELGSDDEVGLRVTLEDMGWTDSLGDRPAG